MAMYGLGPLAGLNGGGFMSDLVLVPYADAMLIRVPDAVDPVTIASLSDNIPDGWRTVGPYAAELSALDPDDRRVLVVGRLSIGLYAAALAAALGAHVDYVDTDPQRLAAAEKLGAVAHDRDKPDKSWAPYPVTAHTSADPALLAATLRATWPDGVCTDTGIYYQPTVEMPLLPMYTRGARPAGRGLRPVAGRRPRRCVGRRSRGLADDDRQDGLHQDIAFLSVRPGLCV